MKVDIVTWKSSQSFALDVFGLGKSAQKVDIYRCTYVLLDNMGLSSRYL